MENLSKDLTQLMHTGSYQFMLSSSQSGSMTMVLQYEPSRVPSTHKKSKQSRVSSIDLLEQDEVLDGAVSLSLTETWKIDQINDFVHQLSFFDAKKEEEAKVRHFQHVNEVSVQLTRKANSSQGKSSFSVV